MHKRIMGAQNAAGSAHENWLDLNSIADVELTSEDPAHPIETVFSPAPGSGWKAATGGVQTIRLLFKHPQTIRRIRLEFMETAIERNQEFALHYAAEDSATLHEIVRQQWTFSPQGSTKEVEEYSVDVPSARILQLTIDPDQGRGNAVATLNRWSVA